MKRTLLSLAALLIFGLSSSAFADTLTFQPTPTDMFDLDHHSIYTWRIDNVNLNGKTITGAKLTIKNIANWDSNPNRLFLHLLDSAKFAGVTALLDANPNQAPVTDIVDDFVNTRYHNGTNALGQSAPWLLNAGTADTFLSSPSFTMTPTNYVLNLSAAQLQILSAYIANGSNFALGFDPDCHFFNDGITFEITTATTIPEPATMVLLGTGLAGVAAKMRKRRQQKAS